MLAVGLMELQDHVGDALDGARHLAAAFRLLLTASLHLLGDESHVVRALHDQLGPTRLLGRRGGDLLDRLGDAADRIGHLLRALDLLDGSPRNATHHGGRLLKSQSIILWLFKCSQMRYKKYRVNFGIFIF